MCLFQKTILTSCLKALHALRYALLFKVNQYGLVKRRKIRENSIAYMPIFRQKATSQQFLVMYKFQSIRFQFLAKKTSS